MAQKSDKERKAFGIHEEPHEEMESEERAVPREDDGVDRRWFIFFTSSVPGIQNQFFGVWRDKPSTTVIGDGVVKIEGDPSEPTFIVNVKDNLSFSLSQWEDASARPQVFEDGSQRERQG